MNAAAILLLAEKGLSAHDIAEVAKALEIKNDPTAAERKRRQREREADEREASRVTSQRDNVTERVSLDKETSPRPPKENNPIPCERESRAWALPSGVSLQVWTDFLANRKRKRLGNTPTAWKSFEDDLARVASQTGIPPPKLIEQCTAKGWGAIYDPREQGNGRSATNGMGRNQPSDGLSPTTRAARDVFGIGAGH